jgi:hypothetical protein
MRVPKVSPVQSGNREIMLHDIDRTLRKLLLAELLRVPGCPVRNADQITFELPTVTDATRDGEAYVSLYLYDVRENMDRREQGFKQVAASDPRSPLAGMRLPPVYLDLFYLLTSYAGNDPLTEHRLMGELLRILLRYSAVPREYFTGVLEGASGGAVLMSIARPDHQHYTDPKTLWQSLGGTLRPALSLVVTALFDPFETTWTKRVREMVRVSGNGTEPGAPQSIVSTQTSVIGVAVDRETEEPLSGVAVASVSTVHPEGEALAPATRTDARGYFYLTGLMPGTRRLRLWKPGYRIAEEDAIVPARGRSDLIEPMVVAMHPLDADELARERATLAAQIRRAAEGGDPGSPVRTVLSGRLHYPDGRPAAYVPLKLGHRQSASDNRGFYSFLDLAPGDYVMHADMPGIGEIAIPVHVADPASPSEPPDVGATEAS